jgi:hypothetical protein
VHPRDEGAPKVPNRPRFEVAEIFRAHGDAFRQSHVLTSAQRKAMWAIEHCRTAVLGGHVDVCADCGDERPSYNSCRNRHCPKCQALAQARWLERQRERILPTGYFHVVFTLPSQLGPIGRLNPKLLYGLLFEAASGTLLTLGRDPKRLGGLLGVTAVLHTWTRDLRFHPHVHCIVTGGALGTDEQGRPAWIDAGRRHLFPVKVLSKLFRGKLLAGLERARARGELVATAEVEAPSAFAALLRQLHRTRWVTYCKRPFAGPDQVFSYLGRYTHRVGLSNARLLDVTDEAVTIATRGGATAAMAPDEFIRRFLLHVLPAGFVKIRHYGLVAASNLATRLEAARIALVGQTTQPRPEPPAVDWRALLCALTGVDLACCVACGGTRVERWRLLLWPHDRPARGPPDVGAPP